MRGGRPRGRAGARPARDDEQHPGERPPGRAASTYEKTPLSSRIEVTAVGTSAAFELARKGDADLVIAHDPHGEKEFIAAGDGASRETFMWSSFEIRGRPTIPPASSTLRSPRRRR
jgi:hypothetical protein